MLGGGSRWRDIADGRVPRQHDTNGIIYPDIIEVWFRCEIPLRKLVPDAGHHAPTPPLGAEDAKQLPARRRYLTALPQQREVPVQVRCRRVCARHDVVALPRGMCSRLARRDRRVGRVAIGEGHA
jgi:hypothetical protein